MRRGVFLLGYLGLTPQPIRIPSTHRPQALRERLARYFRTDRYTLDAALLSPGDLLETDGARSSNGGVDLYWSPKQDGESFSAYYHAGGRGSARFPLQFEGRVEARAGGSELVGRFCGSPLGRVFLVLGLLTPVLLGFMLPELKRLALGLGAGCLLLYTLDWILDPGAKERAALYHGLMHAAAEPKHQGKPKY